MESYRTWKLEEMRKKYDTNITYEMWRWSCWFTFSSTVIQRCFALCLSLFPKKANIFVHQKRISTWDILFDIASSQQTRYWKAKKVNRREQNWRMPCLCVCQLNCGAFWMNSILEWLCMFANLRNADKTECTKSKRFFVLSSGVWLGAVWFQLDLFSFRSGERCSRNISKYCIFATFAESTIFLNMCAGYVSARVCLYVFLDSLSWFSWNVFLFALPIPYISSANSSLRHAGPQSPSERK